MAAELEIPELEIEVFKDDAYSVILRHVVPSQPDARPTTHGTPRFDLDALTAASNAHEYGQLLSAQLFGDPALRDRYIAVRREHKGTGLRVRLTIDRSALELHRVHWEKLREPDPPHDWMLANDNIYFSRFLHTLNGRAATLRPRDVLRSVAFISNPADLATNKRTDGFRPSPLRPIDVAGEEARARAALLPPVRVIKSDPASPGAASLDSLLAGIRDGCDICYLACHGAGRDDRAPARIFLEDGEAKDANGGRTSKMKMITVEELGTRLASLAELPTVIVLASCESAGAIGNESGLASLGPRLIDAGVLAVVAMQGQVTVETAGRFTEILFKQLGQHGEIDRAVAVARNSVQARQDAWMPVLFSRLRQGVIWYAPGFADPANTLPLESLARSTARDADEPVVPVLGPGLVEHMIGSAESLANEFASEAWRAVPSDWNDLPRLAQYRATTLTRGVVVDEILELLQRRAELRAEMPPQAPAFQEVLKRAWSYHKERSQQGLEPHWFIAGFDVPIFITTNVDDSLAHALRARGKRPVVELLRWNPRMDLAPDGSPNVSVFRVQSGQPMRTPTSEEPLVFHLFGHVRDKKSLVVTEDDFFDYLMWARRADVPTTVLTAWKTNPLLFLGFRLEDWRFRVMFRSILSDANRPGNPDWASVAAQVFPEEGGVLPMREYLKQNLKKANIEPYWGRVADFVKDLAAAIAKVRGEQRQ